MPDPIEENGILDQIVDVLFFFLQLVWLQEISKYFTTKKIPIQYSQE
jgi:hypothetical protein